MAKKNESDLKPHTADDEPETVEGVGTQSDVRFDGYADVDTQSVKATEVQKRQWGDMKPREYGNERENAMAEQIAALTKRVEALEAHNGIAPQ